MENKEYFYKYYELYTEDGPLYIYEKYKEKPKEIYNTEIPVTREFFTGEEAIRGYHTLDFLDRQSVFETNHYNLNGDFIDSYIKELEPYDFLMKVAPFLSDEKMLNDKKDDVMLILRYNAKLTNYRKIKKPSPEISNEIKNKESQKILKRYIK